MRLVLYLMVGCLAGCSDVVTLKPRGPSTLVVGGLAGYSLERDVVFNGCDPHSRPSICTPDTMSGLPRLVEASSDNPAVLEVGEIVSGHYVDVRARAPGHATLTLRGEDGVDRTIAVNAVVADRLGLEVRGCATGMLPVVAMQCIVLRVFNGQDELMGGDLDVAIDAGSFTPVVNSTRDAAHNTYCFELPHSPGSTVVTATFAGLTASLPVTHYDLSGVDTLAVRLRQAQGPYRPRDPLRLIRSLSIAGTVVCEADESGLSVWSTVWTSETPEVCTVGLYGETTRENNGTASDIVATTPGLCRVSASVGTLRQLLEFEIAPK